DRDISLVDAYYTATSALCVTGLVVVDTGSTFSLAGELIVLGLIQFGGFGLMTFFALVFIWAGSGVSMQQFVFLKESYSQDFHQNAKRILYIITTYTVLIETIGAGILVFGWDHPLSLGQKIYYGIFHSVSAFNNAGFGLFPDNLVSYQSDVLVNLAITGLIILGGIGAPVILDCWSFMHSPTRYRFSLHTKLVATTTLFLILAGTFTIWFVQRSSHLYYMPLHEEVLISYFQAVSARTAGFNTVDLPQFGNAAIMVLMVLMFIGASPGSCGGGIKTTSFATMLVVLWNRLMGRNVNNIFRSTLSADTVSKTLSIFVLATIFIMFILTGLLMTQQGNFPHVMSGGIFVEYLFETISAFGTVGLSIGATAKMDSFGKCLIMLAMLVGRVGIMTVIYIFISRESPAHYQFVEENVMIG
ncbi:MAG TPA: potassium transporter TrkG, partial [Desulfomonilia bacterium]|nr:potassium transporter TrkG [Desulfomonilia bacterium]